MRLVTKLGENPKVVAVIVLGVFMSSTFFTNRAFASGTPGCGIFEISPDCDLSGWIHFFLGLVIGAFLALLFYYLEHRNMVRIDKILDSQEALRNRRKDYAVLHTSNLLQTLLFTMGLIKREINNFNNAPSLNMDGEKIIWIRNASMSRARAAEARMGRVLQSIRSVTIAANDVLEPELVNQVEAVCTYIGELSAEEDEQGTMEFPKYEICRTKIAYLIENLQDYSIATHSFGELIEEPYVNSIATPKATLVEEEKS